jgi:hypothetical protein
MRWDRLNIRPKDTSEVPKGRGIFYQCARCFSIVPCAPPDNAGCRCGNVFVDIDALRLAVRDMKRLVVLKRTGVKRRGKE